MAGIALALGLLSLIALREDSRDLKIRGKYLSDSILQAYSGPVAGAFFGGARPAGATAAGFKFKDAKRMAEARELVAEAGTNALPLLESWLKTDMPSWRIRLGAWLCRQGVLSTAFPPKDLREVACRAIINARCDLSPLAGQVAALYTNTNMVIAERALEALTLRFIDIEKIPAESLGAVATAIEKALSNPRNASSVPWPYYPGLDRFRTFHRQLEPLLALERAQSPADEAKALRLLSRRSAMFAQTYPHLLRHLESSDTELAVNAAICLRNYGVKATAALPKLEAAQSHPDERVRIEVTNALVRITALAAEKGRGK